MEEWYFFGENLCPAPQASGFTMEFADTESGMVGTNLQKSFVHLALYGLFFALFYSSVFFILWLFQGLVPEYVPLQAPPEQLALLPSAIAAAASLLAMARKDLKNPIFLQLTTFFAFWLVLFLGFWGFNLNPGLVPEPETFLGPNRFLQSRETFFLFEKQEGQRFEGVISYDAATPPPRFNHYGGATLDRQENIIVLGREGDSFDLERLEMRENNFFLPENSWDDIFLSLSGFSNYMGWLSSTRLDQFLWYAGALSLFWVGMALIFLFNNWPLVKWIWVLVFIRGGLFLFDFSYGVVRPMFQSMEGLEFLGELLPALFFLASGLFLWGLTVLIRQFQIKNREAVNA